MAYTGANVTPIAVPLGHIKFYKSKNARKWCDLHGSRGSIPLKYSYIWPILIYILPNRSQIDVYIRTTAEDMGEVRCL